MTCEHLQGRGAVFVGSCKGKRRLGTDRMSGATSAADALSPLNPKA